MGTLASAHGGVEPRCLDMCVGTAPEAPADGRLEARIGPRESVNRSIDQARN